MICIHFQLLHRVPNGSLTANQVCIDEPVRISLSLQLSVLAAQMLKGTS